MTFIIILVAIILIGIIYAQGYNNGKADAYEEQYNAAGPYKRTKT